MSNEHMQCKLKYLIKGVQPQRADQAELQEEIYDAVPNVLSVVVLPVVEGYAVEIEVSDYAPFSQSSFEPYVAEHILPDAVAVRCRGQGPAEYQLIKAHYR